ncbi:MAG TPA: hypothetical protein VFK05_24295 [Polyangiaceae bacterium]|nr:hypothetical protein [Polyangiaceae bacterium]
MSARGALSILEEGGWMIGLRTRRSPWLSTLIATWGATLTLTACSGKVNDVCARGSSCGGASGSSAGQNQGGSAALSGDAAGGEAGAETTLDACANNVKDGNESDVDCGGSSKCDRCAKNGHCTANRDCDSNFCAQNRCQDPTCSDRIRNQDETDVDCGGRCPPCTKTQTCFDGVKNQNETDVDCGGICSSDAKRCPVGAGCNTGSDCESWICSATAGKCQADAVIPTADMIDDFEDGDLSLPVNPALGGRAGSWFAFGDGTGTDSQEVVAIERAANSVHGLHATGEGFMNWGSGFGVDLSNSGSGQATKVPYDASAYAGVTFWARAKTPTQVTILLPDVDTDSAGKICTTCEHHYYATVALTTTWQRFTIDFAGLAAEPGTVPSPTGFKPSQVFTLMFRFVAGANYDVYLDDVAFSAK